MLIDIKFVINCIVKGILILKVMWMKGNEIFLLDG